MMRDELERLVRETAIELGLTVTRTGNPYSMLTDVSTLVASIIRRAAQDGIFILEKKGRKFALQRLANQIPDELKRYAAKINPALIYFQREHGKLTLKDVGNWDETGLDLCAFAQMYGFLCLRHFGNQVAVPFEQSPHITVVVGFTGSEGMVLLAIIKGVDGQPPSPSHAQLLDDDSKVYLGQTATGWINNSLKTAFLKLQLDRGILGARPMVVNVDGHDSNLNNPELIQLASQNKILLVIPPSHTSAAVNGMGTQQCDRPAHQGGPIACLKAAFRRLFKQQWYANLRDKDVKSQVSIAEIAALLAKAWKESFKSSKMEELNGDVGYYINDEDFLQWDLTRLTPRTHGSTGLSPEPPAAPAAAPPRRARRRSHRRARRSAHRRARFAAALRRSFIVHAAGVFQLWRARGCVRGPGAADSCSRRVSLAARWHHGGPPGITAGARAGCAAASARNRARRSGASTQPRWLRRRRAGVARSTGAEAGR
jgi:hypothetical protein